MGYFAKVDESNFVVDVIAISNSVLLEPELSFPDTEPIGQAYIAEQLGLTGLWLQTSYNNNFRGTYCGIGYSYDPVNDMFVPPPTPDPPVGP